MVSALGGERSGQRRQDGAVWSRQAWPGDLTAQDRDLVPSYEEFGVLGRLAAGQQREPADELAEDQVEQSQRFHGWRSSPTSATGAKPQVNATQEILGTHRSVTEIDTDEVAPSLKWATAKPERAERSRNSERGAERGQFNDEPAF